jgi:virginiamycin B lyase
VRAWPLPEDAGYANLNTATFDNKGTLWFTGQAGVYGSLDPATGAVRVWKDPDGRGPYGIATTPDGRVFYASLAGSHIAEIDTATGEKRRIDPPTPGQGARRVWSDSEGNVWVSEWNSGQLSRYTPATGAWKAWRLPGERPRAYAVYVDPSDTVWVSDFGANAVLSFDPATERFTAHPGSGPDANVRQILGRGGEVYLPESGLDRVAVLRTGGETPGG